MRAEEDGFKNSEIQLPDHVVLSNIKSVQKRQNLAVVRVEQKLAVSTLMWKWKQARVKLIAIKTMFG